MMFRLIVAILLALPMGLPAQGQGGAAPAAQAAPGARGTAPVDLTGYWVSIVTEDWIERMAPDSPPSGIIRAGRVEPQPPAGADPCRVYGAGNGFRVPGRVNIAWVDDNTLKVDFDAGTQTRLFRFNSTEPAPDTKTLQGHAVAMWEVGASGGRGGAATPWGSLKVVTTNMSGGYLLNTRQSYSENTVLTEHFTRHSAFGADYFTVTAIVEDGTTTRMTSSTFKKEPNGSNFSRSGCEIRR